MHVFHFENCHKKVTLV